MSVTSTEQLDDSAAVAPRRSHAVLLSTAAVATVVLLLVVVLTGSEPATDRVTESPLLGRPAPPVVGTAIDGTPFDLDDLRGRWVVVNFFATWCAPCRQEHPELVSFHRRHAQAGDATVVSVVYDDDRDAVEGFFDDNGGEWPVVSGDEGRISLDYGVAGVPESYLIDPQGVVRAKVTGGVTGLGLDRLLARLS